jgi:hypothetical protein
MGFLRRLLGGSESPEPDDAAPIDPAEAEASEREYERELLKAEHERLDELTQRQLRYADYAWQPPAEGGERRADDKDETPGNR